MLEVVLLEVAVVVAPEMLNDCTPTFGKLNPWLETDVLVNAAPLENPVCVWVAAVVLGWTGLEGAVIAPGSLEGGALPGAMIALGSTRTWLESVVIGAALLEGQRLRVPRWGWYAFYPVHLCVIAVLVKL